MVLGEEPFGFADAIDVAIVIKHYLKQFRNKRIKMKILKYSETLFDVIIRNVSSTERKLMIDVKARRDACNEEIVHEIIWIRKTYNMADAMTKKSILQQLVEMMETGKLSFEV